MSSLSKLYSNPDTRGNIAVNKSYMVPPSQIYIEPGFNIRPLRREHIDQFKSAYLAGDYVPPLVVQVMPDGRLKMIEGNHRITAILELIEEGHDFRRVACENFTGNLSDQIAYMTKSSQGLNLTAVERGVAYKRLQAFGLTNDEIAVKVGRSVQDVVYHLNVFALPEAVKERIQDNEISPALALELERKGGTESVEKAIATAKEKGKTKATQSDANLWKSSIGKGVVTRMANYNFAPLEDGSVNVTFSALDWEFIKDAIEKIKK